MGEQLSNWGNLFLLFIIYWSYSPFRFKIFHLKFQSRGRESNFVKIWIFEYSIILMNYFILLRVIPNNKAYFFVVTCQWNFWHFQSCQTIPVFSWLEYWLLFSCSNNAALLNITDRCIMYYDFWQILLE